MDLVRSVQLVARMINPMRNSRFRT